MSKAWFLQLQFLILWKAYCSEKNGGTIVGSRNHPSAKCRSASWKTHPTGPWQRRRQSPRTSVRPSGRGCNSGPARSPGSNTGWPSGSSTGSEATVSGRVPERWWRFSLSCFRCCFPAAGGAGWTTWSRSSRCGGRDHRGLKTTRAIRSDRHLGKRFTYKQIYRSIGIINIG